MKIIKNSLKYLLFSEIYQRLEEPKAKRKAFLIIESAIQCYARKGFDQVSLEMIAREAAVTRQLVQYYFKDLSEIEVFALKYIRFLYQKLTVDHLEKHQRAEPMLEAYLTACLMWTVQVRTHGVVWLSFLHRAGRDKKIRALNTVAVETGTERITSLIEQGNREGSFKCSNPKSAARAVQLLITGSVISALTEDLDIKTLTALLLAESKQWLNQ